MAVWVLVVYLLAVMRVTGLAVVDDITAGARLAVLSRIDGGRYGHLRAKLLTCSWCASIWVAAVAVPLVWWFGTRLWLLLPAMVLAASQVTGMAAHVGRD